MQPGGSAMPWPTTLRSPKAELTPILQMGRLAAQTREQQTQLKVTLPMDPRLRSSQAHMSLDMIPANNHVIISDALCSVELGGKQAESKHPERLVYIMGPHDWEVFVGNKVEWHLSIFKDPSRGKERVLLSSELGSCTVSLREKVSFSASCVPGFRLMSWGDFPRSGVGSLSLCHCTSRRSRIETFTKILPLSLCPLLPETSAERSKCAVLESVPFGIRILRLLQCSLEKTNQTSAHKEKHRRK
ncbi:hypothetical protein HPG69_009289, partial [Diceros bicornis minor]